MAKTGPRSDCPISCALDLLGDRWTLVILRDVLFGRKRRFSELARPENIATNVLTDRLGKLERAGIVTRRVDPEDRRARLYVPTDKAADVVPLLVEFMIFGKDHCGGMAHADLVEQLRTNREEGIADLQEQIRSEAARVAP